MAKRGLQPGQRVRVEAASRRAAREARAADLRRQRKEAYRLIAVLTGKEIDRTLSVAERALLGQLRTAVKAMTRELKRHKATAPGVDARALPVGGIRQVVSGGLPGQGRRS